MAPSFLRWINKIIAETRWHLNNSDIEGTTFLRIVLSESDVASPFRRTSWVQIPFVPQQRPFCVLGGHRISGWSAKSAVFLLGASQLWLPGESTAVKMNNPWSHSSMQSSQHWWTNEAKNNRTWKSHRGQLVLPFWGGGMQLATGRISESGK